MKKFVMVLLLGVVSLNACKKDDPAIIETIQPQDPEQQQGISAAEISLQGLHETGMIVGEVDAIAEVKDGDGVEKVEVFLGSNLLTSLTEAPFAFNFDSKIFEDGPYELKIIAYDLAKDVSEWKKSVTVSNKLISIEVADRYLYPEQEVFLLISDEEGAPIQSVRLVNGGAFSVPSPADYYGKVTLSLFRVTKYTEGPEITAVSLIDISRGEDYFLNVSNRKPAIQGSATLKVSGMDSEASASVAAQGLDGFSYTNISNYNGSSSINLYASPTDLFFVKAPYGSVQNESPTFVIVPEVRVGGSVELPYQDIKNLFAKEELQLPDADRIYNEIYGITKENVHIRFPDTYSNYFYFIDSEVFPEHLVSINLQFTGGAHSQLYKRTSNPASVLYEQLGVDVNVTQERNVVEFNTSGEAYQVNYAFLSNSNENLYWTVFAPEEKKDVSIPSLSTELEQMLSTHGVSADLSVFSGGALKFLNDISYTKGSRDLIKINQDDDRMVENDILIYGKRIGKSTTSGARKNKSGRAKLFY